MAWNGWAFGACTKYTPTSAQKLGWRGASAVGVISDDDFQTLLGNWSWSVFTSDETDRSHNSFITLDSHPFFTHTHTGTAGSEELPERLWRIRLSNGYHWARWALSTCVRHSRHGSFAAVHWESSDKQRCWDFYVYVCLIRWRGLSRPWWNGNANVQCVINDFHKLQGKTRDHVNDRLRWFKFVY